GSKVAVATSDFLDPAEELVAGDLVEELRVVLAHVLARAQDDLVLRLAPDDVAALTGDLLGHQRLLVSSFPRLYAVGVGAILAPAWRRRESSSAAGSRSRSTAGAPTTVCPGGRGACSSRSSPPTACGRARARRRSRPCGRAAATAAWPRCCRSCGGSSSSTGC